MAQTSSTQRQQQQSLQGMVGQTQSEATLGSNQRQAGTTMRTHQNGSNTSQPNSIGQPLNVVVQTQQLEGDRNRAQTTGTTQKRTTTERAKQPAIFECDLYGCNNTFKTKYSLQRHYKKHYSQKDLKCRFCTKSFCLPQYKEEHEYTHTGEKPFVCSMCPMRFRQRGKLSYHRKLCPYRPGARQQSSQTTEQEQQTSQEAALTMRNLLSNSSYQMVQDTITARENYQRHNSDKMLAMRALLLSSNGNGSRQQQQCMAATESVPQRTIVTNQEIKQIHSLMTAKPSAMQNVFERVDSSNARNFKTSQQQHGMQIGTQNNKNMEPDAFGTTHQSQMSRAASSNLTTRLQPQPELLQSPLPSRYGPSFFGQSATTAGGQAHVAQKTTQHLNQQASQKEDAQMSEKQLGLLAALHMDDSQWAKILAERHPVLYNSSNPHAYLNNLLQSFHQQLSEPTSKETILRHQSFERLVAQSSSEQQNNQQPMDAQSQQQDQSNCMIDTKSSRPPAPGPHENEDSNEHNYRRGN